MARIAEEEMASKPKIKRGDTKAMKKVGLFVTYAPSRGCLV